MPIRDRYDGRPTGRRRPSPRAETSTVPSSSELASLSAEVLRGRWRLSRGDHFAICVIDEPYPNHFNGRGLVRLLRVRPRRTILSYNRSKRSAGPLSRGAVMAVSQKRFDTLAFGLTLLLPALSATGATRRRQAVEGVHLGRAVEHAGAREHLDVRFHGRRPEDGPAAQGDAGQGRQAEGVREGLDHVGRLPRRRLLGFERGERQS